MRCSIVAMALAAGVHGVNVDSAKEGKSHVFGKAGAGVYRPHANAAHDSTPPPRLGKAGAGVLEQNVPGAGAAPPPRLGRDDHGVFRGEDAEAVAAKFARFVDEFDKRYASVEEYEERLRAFAQTLRSMRAHDETHEVGLNKFSDWTEQEFAAFQKYQPSLKKHAPLTHVKSKGALPTEVDWREQGLVADVKDQKSCGSCWTFSAVASIEGAHAKRSGKLVTLSEQNLVDCVKKERLPLEEEDCCDGCDGGLMDNAFDYIISKQKGSIDTEASYPYRGEDDKCAFEASSEGARIANWTDVPQGDELSLLDALATVGPISVALDASRGWQTYAGGVMAPRTFLGCSSSPDKADHGVAVVGYGTDPVGGDYWIVRNSWGCSWGEGGYMRLKRGVNACGIANHASYPTAK
jgi:hypothetical protein